MAFKYAISNTYAHATFAAANSVVEVSNSTITITAGNGLSGGGSFGLNNPDNASVTLSATSSSGGGLSSGGSGLSILTGNGLFTNTEGLQVKANTGIRVDQDGIFANGSAIFPSINDTGTKINLNLGDGYSYFPNTYLEVGKTQAPGTSVASSQAVGLILTAEANTISSNVSLAFGSLDTGNNQRHGAIINFKKEGLWTAGSGNYPGNLEFYTRPASGDQVLALVIDSTQNFDFQSGNITTTGRLSVGNDTFTGSTPLTIELDASQYVGFDVRGYNANFNYEAPEISISKINGSKASPTATLSGDTLGYFSFRGHDGTSQRGASYLQIEQDAAIGAGNIQSSFRFWNGNGTNYTNTFDLSHTTANFKSTNITTTGTISGVNVTSGSDPGHTHTDYLSATTTDTAAGAITFNAGLTIGASQQIIHNATSTKDKIRLWSSSAYAIGMINSVTYGGLNGYAMTFQMDTTANRGFWWGDSNDTLAQGVMAITSDDGLLTVAGGARIGFGKSDSTDPTSDGLEVAGLITTNQITETSNLLAFAGTGTPVLEINSSAASGTDAELRIDGSRTGSSTSNIARISFRNLGDETAMITMRDPAASSGTDHGELVFRTAKSGTLTDQMIIHHDGLVEVRNGGFKVGDVKDVTATPSTYVFERSDSGRTIGVSAVPSGGLVCNTNVFSGGETVTIYNGTVNDVTIGANTGFTLRLAGTTSTGNRTLAIFGVATILFIDGGASGHISGAGLS